MDENNIQIESRREAINHLESLLSTYVINQLDLDSLEHRIIAGNIRKAIALARMNLAL